ncbi:MAG: hypothetical protein MZU97_21825 [Bacillus subtilis]|nr:hypothetical protein [Bacillus subtilis]
MVKVGANDLDDAIIQELAKDIDTISDLERIGDHLTNILEFFEERHENKIELYPDAKADLTHFFDMLNKHFASNARPRTNSKTKSRALEVNEREEELDIDHEDSTARRTSTGSTTIPVPKTNPDFTSTSCPIWSESAIIVTISSSIFCPTPTAHDDTFH